jgi:hypothetical protein
LTLAIFAALSLAKRPIAVTTLTVGRESNLAPHPGLANSFFSLEQSSFYGMVRSTYKAPFHLLFEKVAMGAGHEEKLFSSLLIYTSDFKLRFRIKLSHLREYYFFVCLVNLQA